VGRTTGAAQRLRGRSAWIRRWSPGRVQARLRKAVGGSARLRVVVLLAAVLGLSSADTSTIGAVASELERSLHIGNVQIGLLVAVSSGIGAVATLPVGILTDRVNRSRLLRYSILIWCAAMVVSGASTSFTMLLISRVALGAVVASAGPAVASLTGDLFPAADRGRVYGFILAGELVGTGFGFLVPGDIAGALSWRYSFWVLAVPGLVLALAIWRLLPEPARGGQSRLPTGAAEIVPATAASDVDTGIGGGERPGSVAAVDAVSGSSDEVAQEVQEEGIRPDPRLVLRVDPEGMSLWSAVRYMLRIRTNVVLIISSALGYFFFGGLQAFAVVFLRGRFGLGQSVASTLLVLLGTGAVVGVLTTGRLADHLIRRRHVTARPVVGGACFVLAAVLFLPALFTTSFALAAPLFFLAAASLGGANPPLDAARLDIMHSRLWGRAESVRTALRAVFTAIAPLLFGYVSTQFGGQRSTLGHPTGGVQTGGMGLGHTFLVMLAPLAVAGLIMLWATRTYPRDVATAAASEQSTWASAG
jgi:predicted MFS family arabinose efflux permease